MARAQQMMLDHALGQVEAGQGAASLFDPARWLDSDGARLWAEQSTKMWEQGAAFWTSLATLTPGFTPEAAVESHQDRSEEHPSELQSLMRTSYAVFCLNKTK